MSHLNWIFWQCLKPMKKQYTLLNSMILIFKLLKSQVIDHVFLINDLRKTSLKLNRIEF